MKKVTGIFFTAVTLCFWLMASFVVAAPPGSQPPSTETQRSQPPSTETQQMPKFPDINAYRLVVLPESPKAGQIVYLKGFYSVTGCASKQFFGKIEVDGQIIGEEQELLNLCPDCTNPDCRLFWDYFLQVKWRAVPGAHTITFTADSKNNISEGLQNKVNNKKSITVNVPLPYIPGPKEKLIKNP
jgi:hypothetical protein